MDDGMIHQREHCASCQFYLPDEVADVGRGKDWFLRVLSCSSSEYVQILARSGVDGFCRRYPPSPLSNCQPKVIAGGWCGEFMREKVWLPITKFIPSGQQEFNGFMKKKCNRCKKIEECKIIDYTHALLESGITEKSDWPLEWRLERDTDYGEDELCFKRTCIEYEPILTVV